MKLAFFNDYKLSVVTERGIVDVSGAVKSINKATPQYLMGQVIGDFAKWKPVFEKLVKKGPPTPLSKVKLRAPLPEPARIIAMSVNYMGDGVGGGNVPDINAFHKSPSCIIGPGEKVVLPDVDPTAFEQEAEIAIVIGKKTSKVSAAKAYDYIFGYANFLDISARGFLPMGSGSYFWQKTWDTFGPIGPFITTKDEVKDPMNLNVRCWINGELRQDYSTSAMWYGIPKIVEWVSWVTTLYPGDIISCGTHHIGLTAIQNGDILEMEVEGMGRLKVGVKDELGREWDRTPREKRSPEQKKQMLGPANLNRVGPKAKDWKK